MIDGINFVSAHQTAHQPLLLPPDRESWVTLDVRVWNYELRPPARKKIIIIIIIPACLIRTALCYPIEAGELVFHELSTACQNIDTTVFPDCKLSCSVILCYLHMFTWLPCHSKPPTSRAFVLCRNVSGKSTGAWRISKCITEYLIIAV